MDLISLSIIHILSIVGVFASIDDMKIYKTDMSEPMRRHCMGEALLAIEKETNKAIISKQLGREMSAKFGKPWIVLVGKSANGLSVDPIPQTYISFSYEEYHFEVFKPLFSVSATDAIRDSRKTNSTITIHKTELSAELEEFSISVIKNAIQTLNDFESIAKNLTQLFNKKYGDFWQVFVGTNPIESNNNYINGTYIHLTIEQIVIALFQTNAQQNKIDLTSVIKRAIASNATITLVKPNNFEDSQQIIEMAKQVLQTQIGICNNCYEIISKNLTTQLINKYKHHWEVSAGLKDTCDSNPYRVNSINDLDFFLAEILFRISRYGLNY